MKQQSFLTECDRECFGVKLYLSTDCNGKERLGMGKVQIVQNRNFFKNRVFVKNRQQNFSVILFP